MFGRSVILARLIAVETFGIYGFASSLIGITRILASFGFANAFMHRSPESINESHAAAVHFTLKIVFTTLWCGLLVFYAMLFTTGDNKIALLWLTIIRAGAELTQTPKLILQRRVVHRRLALLSTLDALLSSIVAALLALNGASLSALIATDFVGFILSFVLLYLYKPVWRPRLAWSKTTVRYYLKIGGRSVIAALLNQAVDNIDDLWTGSFLGDTSLGLYSKAYAFATYPRRILAAPINSVVRGTYAELKGKRHALSQAFFQINALLIRLGFLISGTLALTAPEFILIILGEKWLPMLDAFRLMLVFTLLDPIKITIADIFIAEGVPERISHIRLIQFITLLIGLFVLGPILGISGVAIAVDVMLLLGITLSLLMVRQYVEYSVIRLFGAPVISLSLGYIGTGILLSLITAESQLLILFIKSAIFCFIFALALILFEYRDLAKIKQGIESVIRNRKNTKESI